MGVFVSQHHGLLGTVIELRIETEDERAADAVEETLIAEIERLQAVFNVFDPDSELSRWRRGETEAGSEIVEVLELADHWFRASHGAFDPYVGHLREVWTAAASAGRVPAEDELIAAKDDRAVGSIDLNGIAKGWIVDRALELAARRFDVGGITVNGGGDIRHTGSQRLRVAIEDPHRPYDNAAPLAVIDLGNGAIATSGRARRGWTIEGQWYGHVLDPRTGWPSAAVAQVSVVAESAATTDAVATALTVLGAEERGDFLTAMEEPVGYLIVSAEGGCVRNRMWEASEVR